MYRVWAFWCTALTYFQTPAEEEMPFICSIKLLSHRAGIQGQLFPGKRDWELPAPTPSLALLLPGAQGCWNTCRAPPPVPSNASRKTQWMMWTLPKLGLASESFSACGSSHAFCFLGLGRGFPARCFLDGLEQEATPEFAFSRDRAFVPRSVSGHVHRFLCVLQIGRE